MVVVVFVGGMVSARSINVTIGKVERKKMNMHRVIASCAISTKFCYANNGDVQFVAMRCKFLKNSE